MAAILPITWSKLIMAMIYAIVATLFLTISTPAWSAEVDLMPIANGRVMRDTDTPVTKDGYAYAKAWMYSEGQRNAWHYVVTGCSKGFGTDIRHGRRSCKHVLLDSDGGKMGDHVATVICSRAP
jgi:hypothetical protein